ncbi:MAG: hypothetical protein QGI42_01840, partial [Rhodospirillales bacterium]|nr:hypothetical protein [Rhodospirillales bacterium]
PTYSIIDWPVTSIGERTIFPDPGRRHTPPPGCCWPPEKHQWMTANTKLRYCHFALVTYRRKNFWDLPVCYVSSIFFAQLPGSRLVGRLHSLSAAARKFSMILLSISGRQME